MRWCEIYRDRWHTSEDTVPEGNVLDLEISLICRGDRIEFESRSDTPSILSLWYYCRASRLLIVHLDVVDVVLVECSIEIAVKGSHKL